MFRGHAYGRLGSPLKGGGAYVSCMYKLKDNTPYNTWLVTVMNTTAQYAQCNITVLAVRTPDAEFYSYFVPIFDRWTDRWTDGQTLILVDLA